MDKDRSNGFASSSPKSIWPLEKGQREQVVTELIRANAEIFKKEGIDWARNGRSPKAAQEAAERAINGIAGLFPDPNDPAHILLISLAGMLVDARSGRKSHILLQPGSRLTGTKKGFGATYLTASALAAFKVLLQDRGLSQKRAFEWVAKTLAAEGVSLKSDEHNQPLPITGSAIRYWNENPKKFPMQHAIATDILEIHGKNLAKRAEPSLEVVQEYLSNHLIEAVYESKIY